MWIDPSFSLSLLPIQNPLGMESNFLSFHNCKALFSAYFNAIILSSYGDRSSWTVTTTDNGIKELYPNFYNRSQRTFWKSQ